MKNSFLLFLVGVVGLVSSSFAKDTFKMIHTNELGTLLQDKSAKVAVFDANNPSTRKEEGVIPGAKLLTSYNKYNVAKELPAEKDTKLIFYCANTKCTASHAAAERAIENGYKDVNVFTDGIQGWKSSGKPTDKI